MSTEPPTPVAGSPTPPSATIRADLLPTVAELGRLRRVASGQEAGDLVIANGKVLSVHTGEFRPVDVVIAGRHIAAVTPPGRLEANRVIDAAGGSVVPTFIDAHFHIEYSLLTPGELARLIVPRGTTTVLADPDCIANVLGVPGMDVMRTTGTPLRIIEQVTPLTPAFPGVELGGAHVAEADVLARVAESASVTLGESNPFDFSEVATARYRHAMASARRITGHTARLADEPLWGYLAAGVGDDHNAATIDEVLDRVRLGAVVTVMAGSMNDNTTAIFSDLERIAPAFPHLCFCADDKHVADLAEEGHIDHHVRQAIRYGVPAATAYTMASLHAAAHYRIDHLLGSLTPTRLADLLIVGDLADVHPDVVVMGGEVVAEAGTAHFENHDEVPDWLRGTIRLSAGFGPTSFRVEADPAPDRPDPTATVPTAPDPTATVPTASDPAPDAGDEPGRVWVQAMEMYDGYFKRAFHCQVPVADGNALADPGRDVLKVAVVDRHHASDKLGLGFVRGFGLRSGAMAISSNCTNQNVVVVGATDADMSAAVTALRDLDGGCIVVDAGSVVASMPLPLAGIMSDQSWEVAAEQLRAAERAAADLGCAIRSPFMIMSFVGLAGIPDLGLTELGLVETATQEFTPVTLGHSRQAMSCRCPSHVHAVHQLMDPLTARVRR
jgi:adenine deaminase